MSYAVFIILSAEISSRAYLAIEKGVPFFKPGKILYKYYPSLEKIGREEIVKGDACYDLLFLGGSVLTNEWGDIEGLFREGLEKKLKRKVRIHNLAQAAHTSLDSYYKYRHLTKKNFDLVLLYHGINDVRANNSPGSIFRPDYSHYAWYEDIKTIEAHKEIDLLTSPYVAHYIIMLAARRLHPERYLPLEMPWIRWVEHGIEIKTEEPFRRNLRNILEIAGRKKEKVVLMTFAYHIPENYSMRRLMEKTLDYGTHARPIEIWGRPENVAKGIEAHNKVIRDLAAYYRDAAFADQDNLIPKDGRHFNDICHLSEEGSREFVDNLLLLEIY